jgi:hypothetical protein
MVWPTGTGSGGPFPATLGTTLPISATERVTIALDQRIPVGPWDARTTLPSGPIDRRARADAPCTRRQSEYKKTE